MPRPRQISDEAILEAARRCFCDHGPGCPTSVIADTLGVTQPALFRRFGSKEQLLVAALRPPAVPAWVQVVQAGPDERSAEQQLQEIATLATRFLREFIPCISVLRASGMSEQQLMASFGDRPPPVVARDALTEWFRRAQERGLVRAVDPHGAATVFLGALHLRPFLSHLSNNKATSPLEDPEYIDSLIELLCNGLLPKGVPTP